MGSLLRDLRYAVRALARTPGFSALAILTIALGIGSTTATYSVIDGVVLNPLPFPDGDRFVRLLRPRIDGRGGDTRISVGALDALRETASVFDAVEAWEVQRVVLEGAEPRVVMVARASPGLLPLVGRPPLAGRAFRADDPPDVVVLREDLWRQIGDPLSSPVGQLVRLDGRSYQVVGLMPVSTRYPRADTQAWVSFDWNPAARVADTDFVAGVARLAPGVSLTQGRQQLAGLSSGFRNEGLLGEAFSLDHEALNPFTSDRTSSVSTDRVRSTLYLLLGAVVFVLLISCANVSNLMLARAVRREREFAVRRALGASGFRIGREVVVETLVLGAAAGVLGGALALGAVRVITTVIPPGLFWFENIGDAVRSGRTFLVVLGLSLGTGLATALIPVLRASRTAVATSLSSLNRSVRGSRRRLGGSLVVAEISLALMLLAGAGLLVRSFVNLQRMHPGFDLDRLAVVDPRLPTTRYPTAEARSRFLDELNERVRRIPGVEATGRTGCAPPCVGSIYFGSMFLDASGGTTATSDSAVFTGYVSPSYFATLGIPVLAGRAFNRSDDVPDASAVIVSETTARAWWPTGSPVGRRFRHNYDEARWLTVVGVVGDIRQVNPDLPSGLQIYHPFPADGTMPGQLVVRAESPATLVPVIRGEARAIDPGVFAGSATMRQLASERLARPRFGVSLMTVFAVLGLLLAAGGIFAVVAYDVSQRTAEIGVRIALGATRRDVTALVLRQSLGPIAAGVALGLAGAVMVTRVTRSLLFEVEPLDPPTLLAVTGLLVTIALLATYLPARRATQVEPVAALRAE